MRRLLAIGRHLSRWTRRLLLAGLLLLAMLLVAGRLLSPYLASQQATLEQALSDYLGLSVHFQQVVLSWQGWAPTLRLDGVRLDDPRQATELASFERALVSLDPVAWLLHDRPVLDHVRLEGQRLQLSQAPTADGWQLAQSQAAPPLPLRELLVWLAPVHSLDVRFREVQLGEREPLHFRDLRFSLRGDGPRQRLELALTLPETLGRQLVAAADLSGDRADPAGWRAEFYLRAEELQTATWPLPFPSTARLDRLELWGDGQALAVNRLRGRAQWRHPEAAAAARADTLPAPLADVPNVSTDFTWERTAEGWRWLSDWQGTDSKGKSRLQSKLDLTLATPAAGAGGPWLSGHGRNLRLDDLVAALPAGLTAKWPVPPRELAPHGQLPELAFRLPLTALQGGEWHPYALALRFHDLSNRPWQPWPASERLSGQLTVDQAGGRLVLNSGGLRFESTRSPAAPLQLEQLDGDLAWQREGNDWQLSSSGLTLTGADGQVHWQGGLRLFADGTSPQLDAQVGFSVTDIGRIPHHLPAATPPALRAWLEHALVSGQVANGELRWRGALRDFPYGQEQGLFELQLQLVNAILDYDARWPRLEELDAELTFRNGLLQVGAATGNLFNAELQRLEARLDLRVPEPVLEITAQGRGSGDNLLRFLRQSPLQADVGDYVQGLRATGDNRLDLQLTIPLDPRPNQAQGTLYFTGNNLLWPDWPLELQRIEGQLDFSGDGLQAQDLRLRLRGEPARLDIATRPGADGRSETRFQLRGQFSPSALLGDNAKPLAAYLQGRSDWLATLTLPTNRQHAFNLELTSTLAGTQIDLPPPLSKPTVERRPFQGSLWLNAGGALQARAQLGSDLRAVLELTRSPAALQVRRGELRIGRGEARLPDTPGLTVLAKLPRLALSGLVGGAAEDWPTPPPWLNRLEAQLDELVIANQRFPQVTVTALRQPDHLVLTLRSEALAGQVYLPFTRHRDRPLVAELQRLYLRRTAPSVPTAATATPAPTEATDPRLLPPLSLQVTDLMLDSRPLGTLQVTLLPQADGVRLENVQLRADSHQLTASGDWWLTATGPRSQLQLRLDSNDLSDTLQALGYPVNLQGGKGWLALDADWPAPLSAPALELLNGNLQLDIERGLLPAVEPGVGRVVGLFNLYSLTRRLRLDFGDLFAQGLSFDRLDGQVRFNRGQALTELKLEAPAAQIRIEGPMDLKKRTYQQVVTVAPHLGTPLAIAGTLAGGPVIGAAVLLAGRLFKPGLDRVARYQYTLSGNWDNPVVEPLKPDGGAPPAVSPDIGNQ